MIQIFITGGTFDKSYNYKNGELFFEKTHLPEMLKRSRSQLNVEFKTLMMIDSLNMKPSDIQKIISNCKNSKKNRIVITHGTDTMVNTAKAIAKEKIDKTIILTGAMIPYAFGSSSDGFFNLGCALSYVQTLKTGVYITMHGQFFKWDEVTKNSKKGCFEKR
ncbi:asparaginase domain-containing protein [Flavobacteriaceae bacterium]|jgi:L-asparaginase|nr:asparaginase domain-containing protein [Flavobacteriaceae bacterium]|tara:strand:+ start:1205 stop:1690 length:486 start_codon:yes stop_codon:yes gene_type:complete